MDEKRCRHNMSSEFSIVVLFEMDGVDCLVLQMECVSANKVFYFFSLFLAIHVASIFGHIDIIDLLLEKHADVNATEFLNGQTPLHLAAQRGHQKLIVCMLYN